MRTASYTQLDDGAIFLYTRDGKPPYHARLKIEGVAGYAKIGSIGKRTPFACINKFEPV